MVWNKNIIAVFPVFNLVVKCEGPVALSMIETPKFHAELLKPGATISNPISGNTGVRLAMVSTIKVIISY